MVKQANEKDIPIIENILAEVVRWMDNINLHQWEYENVKWSNLSKFYSINDFTSLIIMVMRLLVWLY